MTANQREETTREVHAAEEGVERGSVRKDFNGRVWSRRAGGRKLMAPRPPIEAANLARLVYRNPGQMLLRPNRTSIMSNHPFTRYRAF